MNLEKLSTMRVPDPVPCRKGCIYETPTGISPCADMFQQNADPCTFVLRQKAQQLGKKLDTPIHVNPTTDGAVMYTYDSDYGGQALLLVLENGEFRPGSF